MKKFAILIATVALSIVTFMCGCFEDGRDGRDGKDAADVTIYDAYEAAKTVPGNENITFDEFLKQYLSYSDKELEQSASLQSMINRSLMSGVTILTRFSYSEKAPSSIPGMMSTHKTYQVYTGSGAIVWLDKAAGDAYVVTNCHVIYDDTSDTVYANDVRLYLYGQDEQGYNYTLTQTNDIKNDENYRIEAEVIGASVTYDIALLKVTASEVLRRSDAVAAEFSVAEDVYAGEAVYAIGNASGEGMSASDGIISKDNENINVNLSDYDEDAYISYRVMRTTAPINHGNSGGALYNADGKIVGIVNAKDEGDDIDNMGYALPASNVRRLLGVIYDNYVANGNRMLTGGGIKKAYLNIQTQTSDSYARYNKETERAEITEVVRIVDIDGSPSKGKLNVGDIFKTIKITDGNGTIKENLKITRRYHVPDVLFSVRKGDTVTVTVERGGEDIEVVIPFDSDKYFKYYK